MQIYRHKSSIPISIAFTFLLFIVFAVMARAFAADLTIWWEKGFYPEEDVAVKQVISTYEQKTGKHVDLLLHEQSDFASNVLAAIEAGQPPDFAYGFLGTYIPKWAYDDVLANLSDVLEPSKDQFFPGVLDSVLLHNNQTGQQAYYALPVGQVSHYVHVWKSLLDQAGIKASDIPQEWDAFWAFWCDTVQPAVRKATGRSDIYGIGLPMSVKAGDTAIGLYQFMDAYDANYMTADGKLLLDDPAIRQKIVKAFADYTAVHRKGCTPPDSVKWGNRDNNKQFHDQTTVMTINSTLSIPSALRLKRPDDYYKNTTTIAWPKGPTGKPYGLEAGVTRALVFKQAKNVDGAKDFIHFLLSEGGLGAYLEASLGRALPAMPALLNTTFWQDATDPHRRAAVEQLSQPQAPFYANINWKYGKVDAESLWEKAINRVVVDNLTPDQAVDEAIDQIKAILSE